MFGCLRRIGCGALLIALGAWGYATKDRWWPEVRKRIPIKMPALRRPDITVRGRDGAGHLRGVRLVERPAAARSEA